MKKKEIERIKRDVFQQNEMKKKKLLKNKRLFFQKDEKVTFTKSFFHFYWVY